MNSIYNLSLKDLEDYFISHGDKKFRASQVFDWLYIKRVDSFDKMTNLKKEVIDLLKKDFTLSTITITKKEILPDNPDLFITTIPYVVGEESTAIANLEANAPVAAGDFSIKYDKNVFSITNVTASNEVLSNGALVVINDNFSSLDEK